MEPSTDSNVEESHLDDTDELPKEVVEPVWGLRFVFDEERAQREVCFTKIPCTKIESILVHECKLSFRTIKSIHNYLDDEVLSTRTQPCVRMCILMEYEINCQAKRARLRDYLGSFDSIEVLNDVGKMFEDSSPSSKLKKCH